MPLILYPLTLRLFLRGLVIVPAFLHEGPLKGLRDLGFSVLQKVELIN